MCQTFRSHSLKTIVKFLIKKLYFKSTVYKYVTLKVFKVKYPRTFYEHILFIGKQYTHIIVKQKHPILL